MSLLQKIYLAKSQLKDTAVYTTLCKNEALSEEMGAQIWLKREDTQPVRSYKLRGAYNKISQLSQGEKSKNVVCASAGNHAQGVAYACEKLHIKATIFMPKTTPNQKRKQVKLYGKGQIEIVLKGDTFDECFEEASAFCKVHDAIFIHPFDDEEVIAGQGTIGLEIIEQCPVPIDYVLLPIGGGGLAAGICTVFKALSPKTKIIGVEPTGAPSMHDSIAQNKNIVLEHIDNFVDGTAVKHVGDKTFAICKDQLEKVILVPEGKVCTTILRLYNEQGIVVEPAGALSVAALDLCKAEIAGKNVVCIISGGNNDITRTEEIKERSMLYEGLKHYFIINFPQRPGALREFVNEVLGADDDITYFQFSKKNNRDKGPAIVGIALKDKSNFDRLERELKNHKYNYQYLNDNDVLFTYLIL